MFSHILIWLQVQNVVMESWLFILSFMTWVIRRILNYAYGFWLRPSSNCSFTCHLVSVHHMTYPKVYFTLNWCIFDGVRMIRPRGISGYFLRYEFGCRLVCIFWLKRRWWSMLAMTPDWYFKLAHAAYFTINIQHRAEYVKRSRFLLYIWCPT